MGGIDAVVEKAQAYAKDGDLRFAAQLLRHAVFADESHAGARDLLADTLEQLGFGAENGPWRNFFLMGALELRTGTRYQPIDLASPDLVGALTVEQLFDSVAIRVNGPRAADESLSVDWHFTDLDQRVRTTLHNGVLVQVPEPKGDGADLRVRLTKPGLMMMLAGHQPEGLELDGDPVALTKLLGVLDGPVVDFAIVTP